MWYDIKFVWQLKTDSKAILRSFKFKLYLVISIDELDSCVEIYVENLTWNFIYYLFSKFGETNLMGDLINIIN